VALALTACGSSSPDDDTADGATAGSGAPVTIEHAFGATEVPGDVTDVVTLGWGSTEAALALGVIPVGIEAQTYAVDENGLLPWVNEALADVDTAPTILPATVEEPAYEDIDALAPDVILAPYSGVTEEQYEILSEIAPTVVYPEEPWTTPWREVVPIVGEWLGLAEEADELLSGSARTVVYPKEPRTPPWREGVTIVGESLGLAEEADDLVTELDATLEEAAGAHPELAGVTVAAIWDIGGTFYVYKPADSRVDFLLDLGLESAPSVEALDTGGETFVYSLSYEQTDQLDADLV